ncbi:MAG: bifunctional UDP-N-acetylglucosamine diphosphorylase/glucosamine-1-phosphate N-acetyltransferase GlmU [Gammaproteobacteria bacterium]|nr:bifunctional UDP-N-acetylglucosamine diphosphorylase/glucosamine-1-phosphate N-acetyltransferase GlmU [Gammaproteobacteria bacterium]
MPIHVVILAAGKGTRMNSEIPKVLHKLGGKPLLEHVVNAASTLADSHLHIVVGHGASDVRVHFNDLNELNWIIQEPQLGTGHAVEQAIPAIEAITKIQDEATLLVLCGDVPLIKQQTIEALTQAASPNAVALLTLQTNNPAGLGRIIRDEQNKVTAIVEEKDASEEQRKICEINSGIMALPVNRLKHWLGKLGKNNRQGEYYLTDVIAMAVADGCEIVTRVINDEFEVQGVNDKKQLASLERHFQRIEVEKLMAAGVSVIDPARVDIRGDITCGKDVTLDINVILEGTVIIGDGVVIGPNVVIKDAVIKSNSTVLANTVIDSAEIESNCSIGPFARIRPGTRLDKEVKVGNFVEIKNSVLGQGSKANHFAYIGDADIGSGVNIGAGTIFCNYDGAHKHRSIIGNNVFIGSNSTLVAPVNINNGAFVAAGSTINSDVPENELAVGRGKQRNISGWKRPTKQ